eukprot:gene37215-50214_t
MPATPRAPGVGRGRPPKPPPSRPAPRDTRSSRAGLGGEERQVTVLFADLRGFTTLSEHLPAPELLALLNRYLDRMSAAIEAHGGVIDKFIGDAIMALFGAPVAQADAADRALAAAVAMEKALAELNRELAAEGIAPLAIGVGINTARVVAGNIGSHRRLNYSVIGDGVNVASRLQSLTRTAEYRTNLITSAATLAALREPSKFTPRPLGTVPVKGRAEPVEIFAVEAGIQAADFLLRALRVLRIALPSPVRAHAATPTFAPLTDRGLAIDRRPRPTPAYERNITSGRPHPSSVRPPSPGQRWRDRHCRRKTPSLGLPRFLGRRLRKLQPAQKVLL